MRWQMSFDFCRRTTYLFCTNIYCSNLHTPEHHLEKVWSWWRKSSAKILPLSTSQKYWLLPSHREGTTYGSRRTDCQTAQETLSSTQSTKCILSSFLTCESSGQPWSGQWCDSVPDVTKRKILPHWWATWWSPQLSPRPVGNLSGCTFWHLWSCKPEERGLGGVLWLWCDHLCLANLPNWYASCDQGQEVEYTLRSKTLKQPPLQKLKPNLSSIQS